MISIIDILLISFNIIGWGFFPFINKNLLKTISPHSFTIVRWLLSIPIAIIAGLFFQDIYTQNFNFYIIIFITLILSFVISIIYNYLLKKYDANLITAIINPSVILLTAIIGSILFNEPFTQQMWVGFGILLIGLIIFILGKK